MLTRIGLSYKSLIINVRHFTVKTNRTETFLLSKGCGVFGALGHGDDLLDLKSFKEINYFSNLSLPLKVASAGWGHSAVISSEGQLYIFGRPYDFSNIMKIEKIYKVSQHFARFVAASSNSALFGATMGFFPIPVPVGNISEPVRDVSCSAGLTLVLTAGGDVYCFGLNRWSQCGVEIGEDGNSNNNGSSVSGGIHVYQPVLVPNLPKSGCVKIDAGLQHCLALSKRGEVYAWGKSSKGRLGTASSASDVATRASAAGIGADNVTGRQTEGLDPGKEPAACAEKVDFSHYQQGTAKDTSRPLKISHISAGFAHSAALCEDGFCYVWGRGMSTEADDKSFLSGSVLVCQDQMRPRRLELPGGRRAVDICSSNFNTIILAQDGTLWAIGMGELDRNANPQPIQVQTDYHDGDGSSGNCSGTITAAPTADTSSPVYVQVPEGSLMRKGHNRVCLIMPISSTLSSNAQKQQVTSGAATAGGGGEFDEEDDDGRDALFPTQEMFEVIMHNKEAYILPLRDLLTSKNVAKAAAEENGRDLVATARTEATGSDGPAGYKILDYSPGWRHSLLIVEEL